MRHPAVQSNQQADFLRLLFARRQRVDGRPWDAQRQLAVSYDRQSGVAHASVGATRVLCSVDCEV
jgi:exosome complex RNA-binding protein Rrp42 (RNase PH superfamily)